MHSMYLLIDS